MSSQTPPTRPPQQQRHAPTGLHTRHGPSCAGAQPIARTTPTPAAPSAAPCSPRPSPTGTTQYGPRPPRPLIRGRPSSQPPSTAHCAPRGCMPCHGQSRPQPDATNATICSRSPPQRTAVDNGNARTLYKPLRSVSSAYHPPAAAPKTTDGDPITTDHQRLAAYAAHFASLQSGSRATIDMRHVRTTSCRHPLAISSHPHMALLRPSSAAHHTNPRAMTASQPTSNARAPGRLHHARPPTHDPKW